MLVWQGSVFKLIWVDILVYLSVYFLLTLLYRTVFFDNEVQREAFELVCIYASRYSENLIYVFNDYCI
jgi:hypothetical protein